MIITVTEIGEAEAKSKGKGKPWYEFKVTYNNDKGVTQDRTFRSFSDDWAIAKKLEVGKSYDVKVEKQNNFWVWTAASETDGKAMAQRSATSSGGKSSTNWDDRLQFDKEKQPLIIRQSVLSTTIQFFGLHGAKPTPEEVIATAKVFEDYINSKPTMEEMEVE